MDNQEQEKPVKLRKIRNSKWLETSFKWVFDSKYVEARIILAEELQSHPFTEGLKSVKIVCWKTQTI